MVITNRVGLGIAVVCVAALDWKRTRIVQVFINPLSGKVGLASWGPVRQAGNVHASHPAVETLGTLSSRYIRGSYT